MNFIEMIKLLKRGKKVTNSEHIKLYKQYITWQDNGEIVCMEEGDEKWREEWIFDFQDYISESWELYEEKTKLHTFEEAIVAFKNGKTIKRKVLQIHYNIDRWPCEMAILSTQDLIANDWIILDTEEIK